MTHVARTVVPPLNALGETVPPGLPGLRDGDVIEIRGAMLRVVARGSTARAARTVTHLQPVASTSAQAQQAATPPAVEASSALMELIAEQFGIEEAQPHRLQPGQASWVNTVIGDFSALKAGANFLAFGLAPRGQVSAQGKPRRLTTEGGA